MNIILLFSIIGVLFLSGCASVPTTIDKDFLATSNFENKDLNDKVLCVEPCTKENTCTQYNPIDGSCMAWMSG